jgi:hypothetical protein
LYYVNFSKIDENNLIFFVMIISTFEGDTCDPSNPGDGVDDTPVQGRATEGTCDPTQDTCPDSAGLDRKFLRGS